MSTNNRVTAFDNQDFLSDFKNDGKKNKTNANFILLILLIAAVAGFIWSLSKYQNAKQEVAYLSTKEGQLELVKKEVEGLLAQVSLLIILPEGEPVVATIQDAAALAAEQAFYKEAVNGDKLLIYQDKAIIYSPSRNIIVNVGPVFIQEGDELKNLAEVAPPPDTRPVVEIRNGTATAGLGSTVANSINQAVYNVGGITNAARTDYPRTIIVNLKGVGVDDLVGALNAEVTTTMPEGEAESSADLVIILGQSS